MGLVDDIRKEKGFKTSELMFGVSPQPDNQCPLIDSIQLVISKESESVKDISFNLERMDEDDFEAVYEDAQHQLSWIDFNLRNVSELEDLRNNIILLRSWGQEWKNIALQLADTKNDLNDFV